MIAMTPRTREQSGATHPFRVRVRAACKQLASCSDVRVLDCDEQLYIVVDSVCAHAHGLQKG